MPENDPLIDWMKSKNIPVTRESYLGLAYPDGVPEWGAELEEQLPEELRRPVTEDDANLGRESPQQD
jgi:hypothetical protein